MSGHNKWSQIKNQKGVADKKRGAAFGKILKAISVAARAEPNPASNPRLRGLLDKAKEIAVPKENIERAIAKTADADMLEELTIEAYGPGGIAIMIHAITDSRNRTISEIKHLLSANSGKFAEQGSVRWAFDGNAPKFPQTVSETDKGGVRRLVEILEENDDVQSVVTNLAP